LPQHQPVLSVCTPHDVQLVGVMVVQVGAASHRQAPTLAKLGHIVAS
jgi:hypothetical protein